MENENKKRDYLLPAAIVIAAVLVGGALVYSTGLKNTKPENQNPNNQQNQPSASAPQIDGAAILGDPKAPLTIFIYSDYQCPFCGKFYQEAERQIRKDYVDTGKVNMVYKNLAFLGPESIAAANAAECAKDQGKFWQYHDALFDTEIQELQTKDNSEGTGNLTRDLFKQIASNLKMNVNNFLSCYDSQKYNSEIQNDTQEAQTLLPQVSTPTIYIAGQFIQGAYPYGTFKQAIDAALNAKK